MFAVSVAVENGDSGAAMVVLNFVPVVPGHVPFVKPSQA
jgi:hypothetical protein